MKEIGKRKTIKQIICIIVVVMSCNFIVPNYSYAVSTEGGGSLLNDIAQLVCFIPDSVINLLQEMFITTDGIYDIGYYKGDYKIVYSPGTIFAGQIPAFDINFIKPAESKQKPQQEDSYLLGNNKNIDECINQSIPEILNDLGYSGENTGVGVLEEAISKLLPEIENFINNIDNWGANSLELNIHEETFYLICVQAVDGRFIWSLIPDDDEAEAVWVSADTCEYDDDTDKDNDRIDCDQYDVYNSIKLYLEETYGIKTEEYNEAKDEIIKKLQAEAKKLEIEKHNYCVLKNGENTITLKIVHGGGEQTQYEEVYHIYKIKFKDVGEYKSSSKILQGIVATWYKALRRIALVGLLSVLVYIGIRIVLTSTSAKNKAKYKKMLKDWLVALCILFTLHYVMSITITVVNKINEIISVSVVGAEGEDVLMTTVRNNIAEGDGWGDVLPYVAIYCVLAVYTVIFTIQYIRRVIYIGFLTIIAPFITLTYPLDKIKDNKSQAFDMWLKDYIFFSLLQVLHLLIYYIFLGSAIDLTNAGNWIFAIVAIGFITKAEKIMKKMFGFEKSKSMGALAAGATGALVMNAMNKISPKPSKGGSAGGTSVSTSSGNVRTATTNPLAALSAGGAMPVNNSGGNANSNSQGTGMGGTNTVQKNNNKNSSTNGTRSRNRRTNGSSSNNTISNSNINKPKRKIWNGVTTITGRYFPSVAKGALSGLLGGTGAIIGFSAGVAQGDAEKAFAGLITGATGGIYLASNTVDYAQKIVKDIPEAVHNVADTYREGKYGAEYANNFKKDREFRKSKEYKDLKNSLGMPDKDFDERVSQMLEAGITDSKRMKKILQNNKKHPRKYSMDKAIAYSELAEICKEDILYENKRFIRFCEDKGIKISENELINLRKNIIDFK